MQMLSIVVPAFNEQESLAELHRQILQAIESLDQDAELILVDDGSTDRTWEKIQALAAQDSRVSGIRFRRNFGKAAALTAGLQTARGNAVLMMDADLQDDPAEIPAMIAKLEEGYDVVNGWKIRRLDPWHKVYPSKVFNALVGWLTGLKLHDHNCGLKLFRRDVAADLNLYGELHRFVPVLAYARGYRVTELAVRHRPRTHGHSKYGWRRFTRGFLDLLTIRFLTGFGQRPLHLLGGIGLLFFGLGLFGLLYLSVLWLLMNVFQAIPAEPIGTRPLLAYAVLFALLGFQAVSLGLLAELIVANTTLGTDTYSVAERTGCSMGSSDGQG